MIDKSLNPNLVDLTPYIIPREEMEYQATNFSREILERAAKMVAEQNELTAQEVIIVELERRLKLVENQNEKMKSMLNRWMPFGKAAYWPEHQSLARIIIEDTENLLKEDK